MPTAQLVSVEEYLHTSFEYDAEYVEGRIVYRPMPKRPHSHLMMRVSAGLYVRRQALGIEVWPEQRIRTQADPHRYRIPDICVTYGDPEEDVFTSPPFLCIEILSPDDSAIEMRTKLGEYLSFGVEFIWVIDPEHRNGEIHTREGIQRVDDGIFRAGAISVDIRAADD